MNYQRSEREVAFLRQIHRARGVAHAHGVILPKMALAHRIIGQSSTIPRPRISQSSGSRPIQGA